MFFIFNRNNEVDWHSLLGDICPREVEIRCVKD